MSQRSENWRVDRITGVRPPTEANPRRATRPWRSWRTNLSTRRLWKSPRSHGILLAGEVPAPPSNGVETFVRARLPREHLPRAAVHAGFVRLHRASQE